MELNRYRLVHLTLLLLIAAAVYPQAGSSAQSSHRMSYLIDISPDVGGVDRARIDSTFSYYLSLSDDTVFVQFEAPALPEEGRSSEELETLASRYAIETLIYILITRTDDPERATIENSIYSATMASEQLETREFKIEDLKDFDTIHEYVTTTFAGSTRIGRGWGTVRFRNRGAGGSFDAYIDGIFAGSDFASLLPAPSGNRIVFLSQERPAGTQILAEQTVTVRSGTTSNVDFTVPGLTDLERTIFERLEQTARNLWTADPPVAESRILGALALLGSRAASDTLLELYSRFGRLHEDISNGNPASLPPSNELLTIRDPGAYSNEETQALVRETEFVVDLLSDTSATAESVADASTDSASAKDESEGETSANADGGPQQGDGDSGMDESGEIRWDDPQFAEALRTIAPRIREEGLFGPLLWSKSGSVLSIAAQIVLDFGIESRLFSAEAWEESHPAWGPAADSATTIFERAIIDFGGSYPYFAIGSASGQGLSLLAHTAAFPYRELRLPGGGRGIYALSVLLELGGVALDVFARNLALEAVITERALEASSQVSPDLWRTYRTQYTGATIARYGSYFTMGSSIIIGLTAAASTGTAGRVLSGAGQIVLYDLGSILASAAGIASYLSLVFRAEAEHHWDSFSSNNDTSAYESYNSSIELSKYTNIASFGLLAGAAISWITAILLPPVTSAAPAVTPAGAPAAESDVRDPNRFTFRPYLHATMSHVTLGASIGL